MENPYVTPKANIIEEDPRVIDLLVKHQSRLPVIKLLRSEGMRYESAKAIVDANAFPAQQKLNLMSMKWKMFAWMSVAAAILFAILLYRMQIQKSVGVVILFLFCLVANHFFHRCKKISFW